MKTEQERLEFARGVDFAPLKDAIRSAVMGDAKADLHVDIVVGDRAKRGGGIPIEVKSADVRERCGMFGRILKAATVANFGGGVYDRDEGCYVWLPIHIEYKHVDGGYNGMDLLTAWYYADERGWEIQPVWERK